MISGTNTISHSEDFSQELDNLLFYASSDRPYTTESIIRDKYLHYMQYFDDSLIFKDGVNLEETFSASSGYEVEKQSTQTSSNGLMDSAWPMFCYDIRHTSQSPYSTANNCGGKKWQFSIDGLIEDSPIIGNNGVIYFGGSDYRLHAVYLNGTEKWSYFTGGTIWGSSPAIADDGTIYVGSWSDYLHAINTDGTEKWRFGTSADISSSPSIADDGTLYFGTLWSLGDGGKIYAVNSNGTEKWHYQTGWHISSSPAIAEDGTIYIGSGDTYLYALYPNGTLKWRYKTDDEIHGHPSIANDGTIYIGSYDDFLHAVYPNGTMKWKFYTNWGTSGNPSIGIDGTIYVGTDRLYAINPDGTLKWSFELGPNRQIGRSSPAISGEGTIYVGIIIGETSGGELIAVYNNGTEKWRKNVANDYVHSSPSIDKDGTIYIGSSCHDAGYPYGYLHAFNYFELEADAHGPYIGIKNESVQFTGSADGGYPPYSYYWDFGDGETSEEQNPSYEYTAAGNYTVTLTVTDDNDTTAIDTTWALIRESNDPPGIPNIEGETHGHYGESYDYTFITTDLDDDDVWYYIEWGDGEVEEWIGPYSSGEEVVRSHTWDEQGEFTIRAKARDIFDAESDWAYLEVSMPVNQQYQYPLFHWFLEMFPNAFPIVRTYFGLQ